MPQLTNEEYLKKISNDYILTILVSRRVNELNRGSRPLIETQLKDPIEIAFEELRLGKIEVKVNEEGQSIL